jgi:hypothetical protein
MADVKDFGTSSNRLDFLDGSDGYLVTNQVFKKDPRSLVQYQDLPNGYPIVQHHEGTGWDWELQILCMGATYAASRALYKALYDMCLAAGAYSEFASGDRVEYREQIDDEAAPRVYEVVRGKAVENRKLTHAGYIEVALSFTTKLSDSGDP